MREKSLEETINRYEVDLENIRKQRKEIIREAKEEALHISGKRADTFGTESIVRI